MSTDLPERAYQLAVDMVRLEFDLIMVAGTTAALAQDSSGVTLPLLATQILWINSVTDGFAEFSNDVINENNYAKWETLATEFYEIVGMNDELHF